MSTGDVTVKVCCHCRKAKPRTNEHFHRSSVSKDGLHTVCKPCRISYNTIKFEDWRRRNLEHCNAKAREYQRRLRQKRKAERRSDAP